MSKFSDLAIETRATQSAVELRGGSRKIGGLGAVFGRRSHVLPGVAASGFAGFREIVEPSAFSRTEKDGWSGVVCRWEHRGLLGTTAAGTLQLRVDTGSGGGLNYECDVPDTSDGNDCLTLIRRGDVRNSSFAFQTYTDTWTEDDDGWPLRHLVSVRLIDCSPVTIPAYPDSTVAQRNSEIALRSMADYFDAPYSDVLACDGDYSKFFRRSDAPVYPHRQARRMSPKQRQRELELLEMRWPPEHVKQMTSRQKQVEVARMAIPPERRSGRQALIETMAERWPND
ncbi:HK97 family phage prohead protease [Mycobacterium sp.]|uniref:HK97 family phage prohead protease n=1 Tax=Mycobacterium sp. TaxID=1785 RepID=UPI003F9D83A4